MEEGLAQIYFVSNGNCRQRAKIDLHIPKKKAIDKGHVKKKAKFHEQVEMALEKLLNPAIVGGEMLQSIKAFLIGSPGTHKNKLMTYLQDSAKKNKIRWLQEILARSLLVQCTNGYKQALQEMMNDK